MKYSSYNMVIKNFYINKKTKSKKTRNGKYKNTYILTAT